MLAARPRSRRELQGRLLRAGFDQDEVQNELDRLTEVGLLDDARFAEAFVEHAIGERRSGRRAVASSLTAKGVDRATIDRALEGVEAGEQERAIELAATRARRLAEVPPDAAYRRLVSFLARRGYEPAVARRAASAVLRVEAD